MANALVDIIKSGDKKALNDYLLSQSIGGDSSGININGQQNNALSALMRPPPDQTFGLPQGQPQQPVNAPTQPQPMIAPQSAQQPSATITNASLGYGPMGIGQPQQFQGSPVDVFGQGRGYMQPDGTIVGINSQGQKFKVQEDGTSEAQQAQIDQGLKRQMLQAQIAKESGISPKYEASINSFVIPPDAQHPQGQVIPAGGQAGGTSLQGLTGAALLQALPKQEADQIKALAEGRMAFPAGFALKSPYWQDKITKVSQYDPNFDAINYNARSQTRQDFTKGKSADNVTALNTAIQHLGKLSDAYDALGNSSMPAYNAAANWIGNAVGNSDVQKNYAAVATDSAAVSHELAKVFRQTGMSEGEIKDWENKISTSASPAQSKQVIQSALDLMGGRLEALGSRYNQGMGTSEQPYQLLNPQAKQTWAKLAPGSIPDVNNLSAPQKPSPHPQDLQAIQWAQQNPNDPRSAAILKANGR